MASSDAGSNTPKLAPGLHSQISKSGGAGSIRVLLADDHPVVRWGLSCSLAQNRRLIVVGEAGDGVEAVRKAKELSPDVVLMDIDMPNLNGLNATEILREENPEIKVLLLSMHSFSTQMARVLQSGARGFLLKDTPPTEIVAAIAKVADGETCFSPMVARQALKQFARSRGADFDGKALSQRERQVLIGIAEGLSNKEMAVRLGISSRTIETHRGHIMRKLDIHTVAGLTRFAISEGLVMIKQNKEG